MEEVLGKITSTVFVVGTFSFIAAMVCIPAAENATGYAEDLADILFAVFGILFLLSLAALPIVGIAYIWT